MRQKHSENVFRTQWIGHVTRKGSIPVKTIEQVGFIDKNEEKLNRLNK